MPSRRTFLAAAGVLATGCGESALPYRNPKFAIERRAEDLLRRMSDQQKRELVRAAAGSGLATASATSLEIPALHRAPGSFRGIALAATWNPDLALREGRMIAREALAAGVDQILGPSPGAYGDEPWLASRMTVAGVSGLQGEGIIATVGPLPDPGPSGDLRPLQENRLPPFHAAIEEAGVWSVLAAAPGSLILTDLVRRQWGFRGFFVYQHPSRDADDVASADDDARSVLRAMFASGVFDRQRGAVAPDPVERQAVDRAIALQGTVLLRNQNEVLPLRKPAVRLLGVVGRNVPALRDRARLEFQLVFAQDRQAALDLARRADTVVVFADRDIALAEAIAALNRRAIVVLNPTTAPAAPRLSAAAAILLEWFPHAAVTELLFGDANPSGKLPFALSAPAPDLYAFGHGLSYTAFRWSDLRIYPQTPRFGQLIEVMFRLTNGGAARAAEVAGAYVRKGKLAAGAAPPALRAFKRVELAPGETKDVLLQLDQRALSFYDPARQDWTVEPGEFGVIVGSSSREMRLQGGFELFP